MAKKNRYAIKPIGASGWWKVVDTSVMTKNTANDDKPIAYEMAHGCTEEDAKEIATALNYYNNREID